jgi:hypothetical protein
MTGQFHVSGPGVMQYIMVEGYGRTELIHSWHQEATWRETKKKRPCHKEIYLSWKIKISCCFVSSMKTT